MAYDLHTGGHFTGHNAPLFMSQSAAEKGDAGLNVVSTQVNFVST